MAFNNLGPLTSLSPGGRAYWWYERNGGQDFGTQFASADVKVPNAGGIHLADQQTKEKDNSGFVTYRVVITNEGPGVAWHNLQGGGMS
jgi:hypothetical protein